MMFKVAIALVASCVVVSAMTVDELEKEQALRKQAAANLHKRLSANEAGMEMLSNGMAAAKASTAGRTATAVKNFDSKTAAAKSSAEAAIDKLPSGKAFTDKAAESAAGIKAQLLAHLKTKLAAIKDEFKSGSNPKIAAAVQPLGSNGLYTSEFKKINAAATSTTTAKKEHAAFVACQDKKQIHDGKACKAPKMPSDLDFERVNHQHWTNDDSRNGGWLNNREISFTKKADNTALRIFYYDNMRVHGHTSHGMWEIYICDGGGGNCHRCNQPGRLMHWRWSGHQHNWWVNDHTGGNVFGICTRSDRGSIGAGSYKLRVHLHQNRYDLHTGHQGQHGSFMVDEVLKV